MLLALTAALSKIEIFSTFSRLNELFQACLLAMNLVVELITVSMIRRLLARKDVPVSVSSTMASTSRALTSVAP